jgi:hypothetical protein
MASRLGDLDLTNTDKALAWLTGFKALARAKKWTDSTNQSNAQSAQTRDVADNFLASCGVQALEKLASLVSGKDLRP